MSTPRTVFGFQIEAPIPLRTARIGGGTDRLRVEMADIDEVGAHEPLIRWNPSSQNPLDATLSLRSKGGGYLLDIADAGIYLIDPEAGRIVIPEMPDTPLREVRLLGLPALLCFLSRGQASLHGAAVLGPNGAVILAAPGRHGKTSMAAMLVHLGYRLLTEDLCCIGTESEIILHPGPASLRVRADMAPYILPLGGMEEIGKLDDRLVLAATDPGDGNPVPVAAVVLLKGFEEEGSLRSLDSLDTLSDLWLLSFHLPTEEDRARKFNQLVDLADSVPIWELTQPGDPALMRATAEKLIDEVSQ